MNVAESPTAAVDPSWWVSPGLQGALAHRDVGAVYRFLRGRGFSQCRIAALTGQNQSEVSAILAHGRRVTAYDVLVRIADGLLIPRGLMGLAYVAPVAIVWDGAQDSEDRAVRRRAFMGVAAKITMGATLVGADLAMLATPAAAGPIPAGIGLADVGRIEDLTAALDRQELAFGGGSCREAIVGYLNWAAQLRESTMTDQVRQALNVALAHLEELAGWASYDLLLLDSAEHFYLRALHSARLADYPFMAAKALARLGQIYLDDGQYGDALRMFQLATVPAREAESARMTAYLHLLDARVYARRGNAKAVNGSIRRAEDDFADAETDAPRKQTRFCGQEDLHMHIAYAHTDLAQHDDGYAARAMSGVMAALRLRNQGEIRGTLLARTTLALNAYRSGDIAQGDAVTAQILTDLPNVHSRRLQTRLRPLAIQAATHDSISADLANQLTNHLHTGQPN